MSVSSRTIPYSNNMELCSDVLVWSGFCRFGLAGNSFPLFFQLQTVRTFEVVIKIIKPVIDRINCTVGIPGIQSLQTYSGTPVLAAVISNNYSIIIISFL